MKPVVIVGTNLVTRHLIDWNIDGDYWVFNEVAALDWPKRVDGAFQLHLPPFWRSKRNVNYEKYYEWLKQPHPFPIWMIDTFEDVPSSVKYPIDEIVAEFLPNLNDERGNVIQNFTSTPAYAMALACYQRRPIIYLNGIEMSSNTEFFRQRPGFYFWSGIALGLGLKIVKNSVSSLYAEPIYGYKGEVMIQKQEIELTRNKYQEDAAKMQAEMFEAQGSAKSLLEAVFMAESKEQAQKLAQVFLDVYKESQEACFKYGQSIGAVNLCNGFINQINALIDAAGGERAVEQMQENGLLPK